VIEKTALDAVALEQDEKTTIARLAALSPLQYDKQRSDAALALGVSVGALDRAVKEARPAQSDTKGQGRPLELPNIEPWQEPVDAAALLDEICKVIRQHVVLPDGSAEAMALWAVHTHVFDCFNHSPRLAITSPEKGCGKTTALDVLRELVARPLPTSNVTASAVFRTIEIASPTLLIDEADTFLKENEELRGILNSGHRKGSPIIRTVGDDYEPRQFSTWAPAAIAMIGNLPSTLDDRSIAVRLRRRKPTERVLAFRSDRATDLHDLARKAARWAADHRAALVIADPDMGQLVNRVADNWRPLFAIADAAGGKWPKHARTIAHSSEAEKEDQSVRTMLLSDIRDVIAARAESDRISSTELASELGLLEGRPWAEWRNGKPMTAAAPARMLSPFGILPGTRRAGVETFKGYLYSNFEEAFSSYLAKCANQSVTPSQLNNDGHCDTLQTVTPNDQVTLSKVSQRNSDGDCDGVTVSTQGIEEKERLEGRRCPHCNQPGELVECHYGGASAWLHRKCIDAWTVYHEAVGDIPPFLDRRGELRGGQS
jgi:putative DNA primase/helicase